MRHAFTPHTPLTQKSDVGTDDRSFALSGIVRRPLSHDVAAALRSAILGGEILPGERIIESDLAARLNVSRGPVREALVQLEQEGIVGRLPHRGTFVTTLSHRDAREIYTLRALLDGEAASLASSAMTEQDFAHLEDILSEFDAAIGGRDVARIADADRHFHDAVIAASGQRRLTQICSGLTCLMSACYLTILTAVPTRREGLVERHAALIQALRTRDPIVARGAFSQHYLDSWAELSRHLPPDENEPART